MARRRDFAAEYRRRNQLAITRGFKSYVEQRRFSRRIKNRADLDALPSSAYDERQRALIVLSSMRDNSRLSLSAAARQEGTTPDAVRWFVGDAIEKRQGRWRARPADRLYRAMFVFSNGQIVPVDVRGSRKASELARYHQAVRHFLNTGDGTLLTAFEGRSVAGRPYETDLDVLEEMARRHQLDIESIYQVVAT